MKIRISVKRLMELNPYIKSKEDAKRLIENIKARPSKSLYDLIISGLLKKYR